MKSQYPTMTIDDLVALFIEISTTQGKALETFETAKYNRLYDQNQEILDELQSRQGDQRVALFALYAHPDLQVRLNAAKATYALDPEAARIELETIAASKHYPFASNAGMTLALLDEGIGKLD